MAKGFDQRTAVLELVLTIGAPTVVLVFFSGDHWLGPVWGLLLALAFPFGHGVYTMVRSRTVSPVAVVVLVSVLLTGGIGLLHLDVRWFAYKEAAVPFLFGVGLVGSVWTRWPVIPTLLDPLLDGDKVRRLLHERGETEAHEAAMLRATWQMGAVLVLNAFVTFAFARFMVYSPTGSDAFSAELGRYTGWSLPVIAVPSTAAMVWILRDLLIGLEDRTGVPAEELLARSGTDAQSP